MYKENIGTDRYGRTMRLYHSCNTVYCDHVKDGKVVRTKEVQVDDDVILQFNAPHTSGAYIYDEIYRRYGIWL
nr:MAG TPA: hypothetical protein [Caudoviricetes sp.]